jgi:hypothetical protein
VGCSRSIALPKMKRITRAISLGLLCSGLAFQMVVAAMEVAVSVSPSEGIVGRPVEVLVRTFIPMGAGDDLQLPVPSLRYPAASGHWNVLYPIADYPFDVVANSPSGVRVQVALTRDPQDASLWRGSFIPSSSGEWTIVMRNFPTLEPIPIRVVEDGTSPPAAMVGVAALLTALLVGVVLGRVTRRPPWAR